MFKLCLAFQTIMVAIFHNHITRYTFHVGLHVFDFVFLQGLALAIPGPTLHYLQCKVGTNLQSISYIFPARSLGYLFGKCLCIFVLVSSVVMLIVNGPRKRRYVAEC